MDIFMKSRFSSWLIVFLILLNIGTLYLLWSKEINWPGNPPPQETQGSFIRFLREDLQFSDNQIQDYERYRTQHAAQARALMREVRDLKQELHNEIFKELPDTLKADDLAEKIGQKQTQIEKITFAHFLDLKKLCGREQQQKLHALLEEFHRKNRLPEQLPPPPEHDRPESSPPGARPLN